MLIGGLVLDLVSGGATSLLPEAMRDVAPWRLTLFIVGLPAILLALLVPLVVPDPARTDPVERKTGPRDVIEHIRGNAMTYGGFLGGTALLAMVNYSVLAWYATYLIRTFDMPASEAGYLFGLTGLAASVAGGLLLPYASERLLRRGHFDAPLKVALVALAVATPLMTISLLTPDRSLAIPLAAVALFFLLGLGILLAAVATILAPGRIRAQMVALYHVILSLVGFGIGPPLVATLSRLLFNDQGIGQALATIVLVFGALQISLLLWSRKAFARSYEAAQRPPA
jgi:MFS family permease